MQKRGELTKEQSVEKIDPPVASKVIENLTENPKEMNPANRKTEP